MFLLQFNTMRIFDRQTCYSCKFTHTHWSFTHFQHSLFLGCFYLGDLFLPLAVLSSQLPLHWINIETIFTPSWLFPSRRSCAMWDKDLREQLGPPKNAPLSPPVSIPGVQAQNSICHCIHWKKVVEKRQAAETISSFEYMDAGIHFSNRVPSLRGLLGSIPGIQRAAPIPRFVVLTGGFVLVDGVKEAVNNSLQLKRENRKQGKLSWVSVKTKRWGMLSWFFPMPSLSTCQRQCGNESQIPETRSATGMKSGSKKWDHCSEDFLHV